MKSPDDLAQFVAGQVDRRHFFRRIANGTFRWAALSAVIGPVAAILRASPAFAYPSACLGNGVGCPSGGTYGNPCGPSRCCSSKPGACNCGSNGNCTNTTNCKGKDSTWSGQSCWTCGGPQYTSGGCYYRRYTTCCDCKTFGCNDPSNRCISWYSSVTLLGCV